MSDLLFLAQQTRIMSSLSEFLYHQRIWIRFFSLNPKPNGITRIQHKNKYFNFSEISFNWGSLLLMSLFWVSKPFIFQLRTSYSAKIVVVYVGEFGYQFFKIG